MEFDENLTSGEFYNDHVHHFGIQVRSDPHIYVQKAYIHAALAQSRPFHSRGVTFRQPAYWSLHTPELHTLVFLLQRSKQQFSEKHHTVEKMPPFESLDPDEGVLQDHPVLLRSVESAALQCLPLDRLLNHDLRLRDIDEA